MFEMNFGVKHATPNMVQITGERLNVPVRLHSTRCSRWTFSTFPFGIRTFPVLSLVCHGTGYHIVQRISGGPGTPTASASWKALLGSWIKYLGPPQMIVTDGGNEFRSVFERGLEQLGILHHVTAPESPWQNSRAERHGGWRKGKLKQEAKNRWFNAGGYTPVQLVFGELPRVPGELLSNDTGGLVPLSV